MVKRIFVYLHTVKGVATICPPLYLNVNKLKLSRNVLNLSFLRFALRKIFVLMGGLRAAIDSGDKSI